MVHLLDGPHYELEGAAAGGCGRDKYSPELRPAAKTSKAYRIHDWEDGAFEEEEYKGGAGDAVCVESKCEGKTGEDEAAKYGNGKKDARFDD